MHIGPITIWRIIMSSNLLYTTLFAALALLFALASSASAEDGQASIFGDVTYKALDPLQLGKEAKKPIYDVASYFRIKDVREIAARDLGTYIIPSDTAQEPNELGREAKPIYNVASYFRIKDVREIAARDLGTYIIPSDTAQEPNELGKDPKAVYDVDAYFKLKDLREIGSKEKKGFLVPSKIRA
jgi:hypothetical protein